MGEIGFEAMPATQQCRDSRLLMARNQHFPDLRCDRCFRRMKRKKLQPLTNPLEECGDQLTRKKKKPSPGGEGLREGNAGNSRVSGIQVAL
jgi:hypothetical protein